MLYFVLLLWSLRRSAPLVLVGGCEGKEQFKDCHQFNMGGNMMTFDGENWVPRRSSFDASSI